MPSSLAPQVVVKFADSVPINLAQGATLSLDQLADIVGSNGATAIDAIRQAMPGVALRRLFDALSPDEMQALVTRARGNDSEYEPPNFETFLEVVCPADFDPSPLVSAIGQLGALIEYAEAVDPTEDAGVAGASNQFFSQQGYLFDSPTGVSVQSAWAKGADGSGVQFIDIEHAWFFGHEDLPPNIPIISGLSFPDELGHGTAVLGVVAAVDNTIGVVGIAPAVGIQLISVLDLFQNGPIMTDDVASKITLATNTLSSGDVLLLELQQDKRPVERNRAVFQAIRLATGVGIVVVEAAGNAAVNLDSEPFMRDSGSIIVGACSPSVPHGRWVDAPAGSNFGSRIDCYAWGDGVFTTGARNDPVQSNSYFNFSGTSAAAAIIAGVCLLIQNLQRQAGGPPLNSRAMRDILRNPNNGTASAVPLNDRIGVMPDFLKIIPNQSF